MQYYETYHRSVRVLLSNKLSTILKHSELYRTIFLVYFEHSRVISVYLGKYIEISRDFFGNPRLMPAISGYLGLSVGIYIDLGVSLAHPCIKGKSDKYLSPCAFFD